MLQSFVHVMFGAYLVLSRRQSLASHFLAAEYIYCITRVNVFASTTTRWSENDVNDDAKGISIFAFFGHKYLAENNNNLTMTDRFEIVRRKKNYDFNEKKRQRRY